MGVTTAIGGEGGTPVPADAIAEYFAGLEKSGISINFGSYFSETQARVAVLGKTARAPTAEELARMKAHHGNRDAGGRDGDDDGADLSAVELRDDRRAGRDGEGRRRSYGGIYASHIRGEGKELVAVGRRKRSRSARRADCRSRSFTSRWRISPAGAR